MVRGLLGCVAFLALAGPMPQSSFDLRARYGEPDVQRFAIRSDITMAVEYGSDHQACILQIEPRQAFIHGTTLQPNTISESEILEVLDEVVPPDTRGTERLPLFSVGVAGSCNGELTFADYERLQIGLSFGGCSPPLPKGTIAVHSAGVRFKRPACDSLDNSLSKLSATEQK